jgi:hypothetical protein
MSIETMTKLASMTIGVGGLSSIDFVNIPQGYTDLKVCVSARASGAVTMDSIYLNFNDIYSAYTTKLLQGDGSSTSSSGTAGITASGFLAISGANATTSVFSNSEIYIANYSGSNFKTISIDTVAENNATSAFARIVSGLWANSSPINKITLSSGSGSFVQHTTATLYGIKNARQTAGNSIKATGGNISFDGTYVTHTFTSTGAFTPSQSLLVDYLVVAGGGGGSFGGGGAGGFRTSIGSSPLSVNTGSSYSVLVGAGGTGGTGSGTAATNGSDSSFSTITSTGGGYGGGQSNNTGAGNSGGSGGGASHGTGSSGATTTNFGAGNAGGYTPVEGYAGGTGKENPHYTGGGGGGSSAAGGNSTNSVGGNGGAGTASSISGSSVTYAGGGGGSYASTGAAGGGNAASTSFGNGSSATANTGSGGGGANRTETRFSGAGGSGIVIIRYKG